MKTYLLKNLLKNGLIALAILLSFDGFGQNSIDKSSYATSLASVSKIPAYKWEGDLGLEKDISNDVSSTLSPVTCMTLATTYTNVNCSNQFNGAIALTVTGGTAPYAYSWTSSNPNFYRSTKNLASIPEGAYTVQVNSIDGCVATTTVLIGATFITPTLSISASPTLCPGQTTTLTASGANTYTWTLNQYTYGSTTTTIVSTTSSVTAGYTLNANYYVEATSIDGCLSGAYSANISTYPDIYIVGNNTSTLCVGQTTTLTAGGGTSYTWNPGGSTSPTLAVSPTVNHYIYLSGTGTCSSNSATVTINVASGSAPSVSVSGPSSVCSQRTATYTASGASSYYWSFPLQDYGAGSTAILGWPENYISPQTGGFATVTGTNANGCTSITKYAISNRAPTFTLSQEYNGNYFLPTICSGTSFSFSANIYSENSYTYTWTPDASGLNPTVSPSDTTMYVLTINNSYCTVKDSFLLAVDPTPTITLVSPVNICQGNSYTISPSVAGVKSNTVYYWSPATDLSSDSTRITIVNPVINNSTYELAVTNRYSYHVGEINHALVCQQEASITFSVIPSPTLSIIGNPILCSNSNVDLSVSGALTYTWSDGSNQSYLIVYDVLNGGTVPMDGSQIFTVTGTDANGCASVGTYTVTDYTPTFTVNPNNNNRPFLCTGSSFTLSAELGADVISYYWSPDNLSGLNPVVTPTVTSGYELTASNGTCSASQGIVIDVVPTPTVTITTPSVNICPGSSYTVLTTIAQIHESKGQSYFYSGSTDYDWIPSNDLSSTNTATTVSSPSVSTTYSLISTNHYYPANIYSNDTTFVVDTLFCSDTTTVSINVIPNPPIPNINYSSICGSNFTTLNIPGSNSTYTYTWSGPCYNGTGGSVNVNTVGIYTVSVTNSCGEVTTNTINVLVIGNIVAGFQTNIIHFVTEGGFGEGHEFSSTSGNFIHFENISLGNNLIYQWTFGNGDTSSVVNPDETFNTPGVFQVHLYDSDSLHCKDTASATVVLSGNNTILIIPNSFTPNSDNVDDVFAVNGTGVTNFKCQISDKWGNLLYQWNNLNGSWNGIASNGHVYAPGNYFYLLSYTDYYGTNQSRSGIITLK